MTPEEIIGILEGEAEKCNRFAAECRNRKDDDLGIYWVGKRRGFLDAVKYVKRLEAME